MHRKDIISMLDITATVIWKIFKLTDSIIQKRMSMEDYTPLKGKSVALIFQKPSTRTRVSFEVGIGQLGGQPIYLSPEEVGLGVRESIPDVARVLSRYTSAIVVRTFSHEDMEILAKFATVPVISGLSDSFHPCQILADIYTIWKHKGSVVGVTLAYIGDGSNNVAHSLIVGCAIMGMNISIATPLNYPPNQAILDKARDIALKTGSRIEIFIEPSQAALGADVLYTDVWTSMGQEKEAEDRRKVFKNYQINNALIEMANKDCLIMHCLPAHRGEEITNDAIEGHNSIVFEQAENRLHVQKGILVFLMC
ncbi:ornithine carbamoyltransferase [Candidatus Desantisbacteria bacterium]|nr:ornithine carbamoyltransferase [Candidatus Desantisbacteria bacterium]